MCKVPVIATYNGLMIVEVSSPIHLEGRRQLTYAFVMPKPFRITVAELHQIKLAVWLPGAGWTAS